MITGSNSTRLAAANPDSNSVKQRACHRKVLVKLSGRSYDHSDMSSTHPLRSRESNGETEARSLHGRAMDNLRFIRETMERASSFTAVPGWGGVAIGVTALIAAFVAAGIRDEHEWMYVWACELPLALLIGGWTMKRKAGGTPLKLLSSPG